MSELMKVFDIQTDERLRRRTQGAVLEKALAIMEEPAPEPVTEIEVDEDGEEVVIVSSPEHEPRRGYARLVLDHPTSIRQEMVERVVSNPTILNSIEEVPSGWNTDTVADNDIRFVVNEAWETVAEVHGV